MTPLTPDERDAVATICLLAAFADGRKDEAERARLRSVFGGLGAEFSADRVQRVLLGQADVEAEAGRLATPAARTLAYEMAVAVCDADGEADAAEQAFLGRLRAALALDGAAADRIDADGRALAVPLTAPPAPVPAPAAVPSAPPAQVLGGGAAAASVGGGAVGGADVDAMVLRYAVLNGGLELLPQTLATLAVVPMQAKMVYRIGLHYGHELGPGHVKELLATVGVGLTSQVVESYARGLFGGLAGGAVGGVLGGALGKKKGKKLAKKAAGAATGAAFSFATTYALGQVAKAYYGGGRRLGQADLRGVFDRQVEEARVLYETHRPAVERQAQTLDLQTVLAAARAPLGAAVPASDGFTDASPRSHNPLTDGL